MPDNRKPLIYGAFPVCRNYTVRAQQREFAACEPCAAQTDSGVAGAQRFSTTANIYAHLDAASKQNTAEAMLHGLGLEEE